MSWRSRTSRPLPSRRRMISPTSRRRTPSPFTSTSVSSKTCLLLPADLFPTALVGCAVRACLPLHVERSLAVDAGFLEVPVAHGADQVVLLHQVAAVRTEDDRAPELAFEHRELQLALAGFVQELRRADYQVDEGAHVREDDGHDPPEDLHRTAPRRVGVGPV